MALAVPGEEFDKELGDLSVGSHPVHELVLFVAIQTQLVDHVLLHNFQQDCDRGYLDKLDEDDAFREVLALHQIVHRVSGEQRLPNPGQADQIEDLVALKQVAN